MVVWAGMDENVVSWAMATVKNGMSDLDCGVCVYLFFLFGGLQFWVVYSVSPL